MGSVWRDCPPRAARPQEVKASETRKCGYCTNTVHKSLAKERIGRSGLIIQVTKPRFLFVLLIDWLMNKQCDTLLFM